MINLSEGVMFYGQEVEQVVMFCHQEIEQLRKQLAGCGVAALGGTSENAVVREGDYGWSPAYQNVLDLRRQYDAFASGIDRALHELGVPGPGTPMPVSNAVEILRSLVAP